MNLTASSTNEKIMYYSTLRSDAIQKDFLLKPGGRASKRNRNLINYLDNKIQNL